MIHPFFIVVDILLLFVMASPVVACLAYLTAYLAHRYQYKKMSYILGTLGVIFTILAVYIYTADLWWM